MFGFNKLMRELKQIAQTSYRNTELIGNVTYFPNYTTQELTNLYITSDQIYSVINKVAETAALVPVYTYTNKDAKSLRKLKTLTNRLFYTTKGLFDIRMTRTKALAQPLNDDLEKLLEKPNDYMSKTEFFTACYIYYLLNGECIVWIERSSDGANEGKPYQLHIFPPANVSIAVSDTFPQSIVAYNLTLNGRIVLKNVPPEDIIHWKRVNTQMSINGAQLRGLSPLTPATNLTARISQADIRSLNQLKNGFVPGIIYDKSINGDESKQEVFDSQKKRFYDFITNPSNHGAPFFVGTEKGYLPIGLSTADLKLIELQKIDFKRLCNIYKISDVLFNSDAASTESNVQEQIKQMYTSACLPMVYSFMSKLNATLVPLYDGVDYIDCDISSITELQDDIKLMMQAISYMPVSPSGNQLFQLMNYEPLPLPWMDEPLIKQGYSFYNDVNIPPVDPNLLDTGL